MNKIRNAWFWIVAVGSIALITAVLVTGVYGGAPGPGVQTPAVKRI